MPKIFVALLLLLLLPMAVQAHGERESAGEISGFGPVTSIWYSLLIILSVVIVSVFFRNRLSNTHKKILFLIIVIPVVFSTVYLAASTVYLNTISESKGPVHWHADYEIWVCGEKVLLKEPEGFDNKVGSPTLHHHNEGVEFGGTYRIHVEGVLVKLNEASLGEFFEKTRNLLQKDSVGLLLKDGGQKRWNNGDVCPDTGKPGKLKVLVNGKQIENFTDYVISPYTNVPPGDFIKIVFD